MAELPEKDWYALKYEADARIVLAQKILEQNFSFFPPVWANFRLVALPPEVADSSGLTTMAVDDTATIYYDPRTVSRWSTEEVAGVLLHEVLHFVRGHTDPERTEAYFYLLKRELGVEVNSASEEGYLRALNMGYDAEINPVISSFNGNRIKLPEGVVFPETLGFDDWEAKTGKVLGEKMAVEWLKKNDADPQNGPGVPPPAQGQKGENGPQSSSGGASEKGTSSGESPEQTSGKGEGQGRESPSPRETPGAGSGRSAPSPGEVVGPWDSRYKEMLKELSKSLPEEAQETMRRSTMDNPDFIRREIAAEMERWAGAKGIGVSPLGETRVYTSIDRNVYDWMGTLWGLIEAPKDPVTGYPGIEERSYLRPSWYGTEDFLLPGTVYKRPTVAAVLDTSGSIGEAEMGAFLGQLKALMGTAEVYLLHTDTEVHKVEKFTGYIPQEGYAVVGGGGTDMGAGIMKALELDPDAIVVLTDGYTPWPESLPEGAPPVVVVITTPPRYFLSGDISEPPPEWAITKYLAPKVLEEDLEEPKMSRGGPSLSL